MSNLDMENQTYEEEVTITPGILMVVQEAITQHTGDEVSDEDTVLAVKNALEVLGTPPETKH